MKNKYARQATNVFKDAVEHTTDLEGGYCKGLQALKRDSSNVSIGDNEKLLGSVDIDECVLKNSPQYRSLAKHNLLITANPFVVK